MKILHYINGMFYLFTIIIYITFNKAGAAPQTVLGIMQMLMALILIIKKWPIKTIRTHVLRYGLLVGSYFLILGFLSSIFGNMDDFFVIILFVIIPMLIATYFVYITYLLQKQ